MASSFIEDVNVDIEDLDYRELNASTANRVVCIDDLDRFKSRGRRMQLDR